MIRQIIHFLAVFSAAIITGGQYVVSFDYSPTGVTPSFYTEKIQYAIHHIGTPLFGMLIAATVLNLVAAFLYRHDRQTCYILAAAGLCFLVGGITTKFGNIPLLDTMDTWSVSSPPANWLEVADRWYFFHSVRIAVGFAGLFLAILSTFTRRDDIS